jgi:hypothetical protein
VINFPINCCYLEIFRISGNATKYAIIKINGSFETADLVLIFHHCMGPESSNNIGLESRGEMSSATVRLEKTN